MMVSSMLFLTLLLVAISHAAASTSAVEGFDSQADFEERVLKSDGVWLVQFCANDKDCGSSSYSKMADLIKGIIHVARVDITATPDIGTSVYHSKKQSSGSGNHKTTMYIFGRDKMNPRHYTGAPDSESIIQTLMDETIQLIAHRAGVTPGGTPGGSNQKKSSSSRKKKPPNRVVEGTQANYDEVVLNNPNVVLVAFTAPWCGYCKKLKPEWDEAAAQLYGQGVTLVNVDATQHEALAQQYGVSGYHTIKVFPGGNKKTHSMAYDLPVERNAPTIAKFALNLADETGVAAPIPELISQEVLQETCGGANQLCVLAALPHILESTAAGRAKYQDMLAAVQKQFRGSAFRFLWLEGGKQLELETALELTFGYPAVVAVSLERQAYSVWRGSFSEKGMAGFLNGVMTGRQSTVKLNPESPQLVVQRAEPWDGKDGAPIEEEEMSLDEIMGWGDDDDDDDKGEL